jgi:hypothetical protein
MAQLPPPWLMTTATATHVLEFDLAFRAQFNTNPLGPPFVDFENLSITDGVLLYTRDASGPLLNPDLGTDWDSANTVEAVMDISGVITVLASGAGSASGDPGYIATLIRCKRTITNMRLGVQLSGSVLEYSWFTDSASAVTWEIGGNTVKTVNYAEPPEDQTSGGVLLSFGSRGVLAGYPIFPMAKMSGFLSNGTATGLPAVEDPTPIEFLGLTWKWTADLRTVDENGSDAYAADVLYQSTVYTTATSPTFAVTQFGTPRTDQHVGEAVLTDPWASAQQVKPYDADLSFVVEGQAPLSPGAAFTSWNVGTIVLTANADVLLSPTAWTTVGSVTVSANTPPLDIVATATGASVRRSLLSHWRNWNDPIDPLYQPTDQYTSTKRDFFGVGGGTPDVWGWGRWCYLEVTFSAAPAATLSFTVEYAVIREDLSVLAVERTHTVVVSGAATHRIDLLFPNEGDSPHFNERVDAFRISGMAVGTYTITQVRLVADEDAYARIGARNSADLGGFVLAQDGQFCFSHWNQDVPIGGDDNADGLTDYAKDDQNGVFDVRADEADPQTEEHLGGALGMFATTLQGFFPEAAALEGASASYSSGTIVAALTDAFAVAILSASTFPAYWILPNLPHERVAPGGTLTVAARMIVNDIVLPAGLAAAAMVVHLRNRLGCALEAQGVTAARARGAAGVTVTARASLSGGRSSTDAALDTGVSDASGYVTLAIRTGMFKVSAGVYSEFWVYLE